LAYYIAAKEEAFGFFNLTETDITSTTKTITEDEFSDFFKSYNVDFFKSYNADFLKNYNGGNMYLLF